MKDPVAIEFRSQLPRHAEAGEDILKTPGSKSPALPYRPLLRSSRPARTAPTSAMVTHLPSVSTRCIPCKLSFSGEPVLFSLHVSASEPVSTAAPGQWYSSGPRRSACRSAPATAALRFTKAFK